MVRTAAPSDTLRALAVPLATPDLLPEPVAAPDSVAERVRGAMVLGAIFCLGFGVFLMALGLYLQGLFMLGIASVCAGAALNH